MTELLYAKEVADSLELELKEEIKTLLHKPSIKIIVADGYSAASSVYVGHKVTDCEKYGIEVEVVKLNWENSNKESLVKEVRDLLVRYNSMPEVTGYIVQLPLPYGITENDFIDFIMPSKDIDGFTSYNLGASFKGLDNAIAPATPFGIIKLLEHYNIDLKGKDVLVINRSQIVGIGLLPLLIQRDATVTIAHSKTVDLEDKISRADIVVLGVGRENFINNDCFFKDGAVIVDVSINRNAEGKLCGDLNKSIYESDKNLKITPVPKGVGVTTRLALIINIIKCAKLQKDWGCKNEFSR